MYYILTERNENVPRDRLLYTNNSWTAIDTRYYICEFYKKYLNDRGKFTNVDDVQHYGYPLLQQNKLWTRKGMFSNKAPTKYNPESTGYQLWFNELHNLLEKLYKPLVERGNLYTKTKYEELIRVYNEYIENEPNYQNTVRKLTRRVSRSPSKLRGRTSRRTSLRTPNKNVLNKPMLSRKPFSLLQRSQSVANAPIAPIPRQMSVPF